MKELFHILETFGLVQRIELSTYQNGNLLDYIITRQASDFALNFMVSDYMALHASLACQHPHLEGKKCLFEIYAI